MPVGGHACIFDGSGIGAGNLSRAYCSWNESADAGSTFIPGADGRPAETDLDCLRAPPEDGEGKAAYAGNSADWKGLCTGRGFWLV